MPQFHTVSEYIASFPLPARAMMQQLRRVIKTTAPQAREKISYAIPFYEYKSPGYKGRLVYFGAFKKHVSMYAWGKEVNKYPGLKKYKTSTGTLQFPIGSKIPIALVKQVVKARLREIDKNLKKHAARIKK